MQEAIAGSATQRAYRAVIDRRYSLSQIVEAHRHVDTGRKRGSVMVIVRP